MTRYKGASLPACRLRESNAFVPRGGGQGSARPTLEHDGYNAWLHFR